MKLPFRITALVLSASVALVACAPVTQVAAPNSARTQLTWSALMEGTYHREVDMAAFAPGADASAPSAVFEGTLRVSGDPQTRTIMAKTGYLSQPQLAAARTFPGDFAYDFVQAGDVLLPVRRGYIVTNHPHWDFVLEPGRVWDEPGERGYSRAALPFALVQKHMNCTHYGVLSFLFRADGSISQAAMQISSETCNYLKFDMWGLLHADYAPHSVAAREAVVDAWRQNRARQFPQRPIAQIAADFPGVDPAALAVGEDNARTLYGLVVDGTHYVSACPTRRGNYPYCSVLPFPSYSTAKSAQAALALMVMEQRHPGLAALAVDTLAPVPGCESPGWDGVRLRHLVDMTTGHYDATGYMDDEDAPKVQHFFFATSEQAKAEFACNAYPRKSAPGSTWVYHTSDTFLLGTALDAYLRSLPGREHADIFRDVVDAEIYEPLGLSATARDTRRTADAAAQPLFGYGLQFHRDDIARLALFVGQSRGMLGDDQVLDPHLLDLAMQRVVGERGSVVTGYPDFRYQLGFWARDVSSLAGCKLPLWVPFMSGFGGISVVLFPHGVVYYNVSDSGSAAAFDWGAAAVEVNQMNDLCG